MMKLETARKHDWKIYQTMKEVSTKVLKQYLKEECLIDPYDDLGARGSNRRLKNQIETELKRRKRVRNLLINNQGIIKRN